jgi:hypothetical protein
MAICGRVNGETKIKNSLELVNICDIQTGMKTDALDRLIEEVAESQKLVAYLKADFSGANSPLADLLLAEADEGPFSLHQWVEALCLFKEWLETRELALPIENQIGYIGCAAEAGSAYSTLTPLALQVEEMLEAYGCDHAVKR